MRKSKASLKEIILYRPLQRQSPMKRYTACVPGFESVCQCCPTVLGSGFSRQWTVAACVGAVPDTAGS